jgi:hypothetical protein
LVSFPFSFSAAFSGGAEDFHKEERIWPTVERRNTTHLTATSDMGEVTEPSGLSMSNTWRASGTEALFRRRKHMREPSDCGGSYPDR